MNRYVLLILILLVSGPRPAATEEKVHPQLGLSIESHGQVFFAKQLMTIKAVLSLGDNELGLPYMGGDCPELLELQNKMKDSVYNLTRANIDGLLKSGTGGKYHEVMCNHMKAFCQTENRVVRHRRFLFTLGAVVAAGGLGYWMYNRLSSSDTAHQMKQLKDHLGVIQELVKDQSTALRENSLNIGRVWSFVLRSSSELRVHLNCQRLTNEFTYTYAIPLLSTIPNQFHRGVSDLLSGRLTPDLVGYNQVKELMSEGEWKDTIYALDPALFYQLGHTIIVSVDSYNLIATFLIQLPFLEKNDVGIHYQLYNFGRHNQEEIRKLNLPNHIAHFKLKDDFDIVLPIEDSLCTKIPGTWLCGQEAIDFNKRTPCVTDLFFSGSPSKCSTVIKKRVVRTDLMATGKGVFISSSHLPITIFNVSTSIKIPTILSLPESLQQWVDYSSFDELTVDHYHIRGQRNPYNKPLITGSGYHIPHMNLTLPESLLPSQWTDIEYLNKSISQSLKMTKDIQDRSRDLLSPDFWITTSYNTTSVLAVLIVLYITAWIIQKIVKQMKISKEKDRLRKESARELMLRSPRLRSSMNAENTSREN